MKKNNSTRIIGTTLVEVVVASFLLFTISGTIALALTTVFDGYMVTQQGGSVEQDAQLMLSRVRFASEKHNDAIIFSHTRREDFLKQESSFSGTTLSAVANNYIKLQDGALLGTYISSTQSFSDLQRIRKLVIVGNSSTTSAMLKVQLAAFPKTNGSCDTSNTNFVGPDKTPNTFYSGLTNDILESQSGIFINPAECVRYKIYLERDSEGVDTPKIFEIRLEK